MIEADRGETALPVTQTFTKFGLEAGATLAVEVRDPRAATFLDFADDTFKLSPAQKTKNMTEESAGRHETSVNISGMDPASDFLVVRFIVTAGGVGATEEVIKVRTLDLSNLDVAVSSRSSHGAPDLSNLDAAVSSRSSHAAPNLAPLATAADLLAVQAHGDANWSAGGTLTLEDIADAVWDEVLTGNHEIADSAGAKMLSASAGGVDYTALRDAVWNAILSNYDTAGSAGAGLSKAATTEVIDALLNQAIRAIRRYGPVLVKQPIATRDQIHAGDVGSIMTVPIILDGAYADLSGVDSITFTITAPDGTEHSKPGASVNSGTNSYATWTSDADVFTTVGRWVVKAAAVWPDLTTKQSLKYPVDVVASSPL